MSNTKEQPIQNEAKFPKGNAKVGDEVQIKQSLRSDWTQAKVTRVGLRNEHGYYLNIEIRYNNGHRVQINPCGSWPTPRVLVFSPESELPQEVKDWLAKVPGVRAIRDVCNSADDRYKFVGATRDEVCLRQESVELATLEYHSVHGWGNGKWEVDSSGLDCGYGEQMLEARPEFEIQF